MTIILFVCLQQLEAAQKALLPLQDSILALAKLTATLAADAGKPEAEDILKNMRKADESIRDRLFILQVWRKYDHETAERLARTKAGEFLDPDLAKVLEERQKRLDKEKRAKEREKEKTTSGTRRWRGGAANYSEPQHYQQSSGHFSGRGGYGGGGRGGGGPARGLKRPSEQNTCHICGASDHFLKQCPNRKSTK